MISNVIFDLDSTLVTIEGIDELARFKGVAKQIEPLTLAAMNGELSFEEVFAKRLQIIAPTKDDVIKLGKLYQKNITKNAIETVKRLHSIGVSVFIVSGGYNPAVTRVAKYLQISPRNIFANELEFDNAGNYQTFNTLIPLWKGTGKQEVIKLLKEKHEGTWALIGDSMSDLEASELVDQFICFTGVTARPKVQQKSTYHTDNLLEIFQYLYHT